MRLLATLLAVFGTLHAHAQGLIWSVNPTVAIAGNAGPVDDPGERNGRCCAPGPSRT